MFIEEDEPASDYFVVTHGTATIFKSMPDGRRQIIDFAGAGRLIGSGTSDANSFSAEALEPLRVCRFAHSRLGALFSRIPSMERRLLELADSALSSAWEHMVLLGRKTARERLASFLLARSWQATARGAQPKRTIRLPMSRLDVADYLGLTKETVSRGLRQFCAEGIVNFPTPSEFVILGKMALERMAHGSALVASPPRSALARAPVAATRRVAVAEMCAGLCMDRYESPRIDVGQERNDLLFVIHRGSL
jgi:CRP/FNR family transcriptional regulator